MTGLLAAAWLVPLLCAPLGLANRLWWVPAVAAVPALVAAVSLPAGTQLEIPWLLLGTLLRLDQTGRIFLTFTAILWLAAGLYAAQSLRDTPHAGRFRAFFLLAMTGNLWLIVGQDLLSFYLGFALMGLSSYGLVIHHEDAAALRAGKVYLVMTILGEVALFVALVLIAAQTDSLTPAPDQLTALSDLTIGLLILGLAVKAGLVPLHIWLPLAHPAAPIPASAVLSGAMIKVALLGWLRFLPIGQAALPEWGMLLVFAGLLTLFFAIPIGLVQADPKVVLAYSSVSKMGLLALVLGLMLVDPALAPAGILALSLYAAHHALVKGGLFLGVGLRRYASAQPLVLAGLVLLALSLAGAPPSSGAVAKYGIKPVLSGTDWSWLSAAVTLSTAATTLLMARFFWVVWRIEPHPGGSHAWEGAAWGALIGLVLLFPLIQGTPAAWASNAGPVLIGSALALPIALVAWRKPKLLSPLVGLVRPGDLLGLVRPVLIALRYLVRALWRQWQRLLAQGLALVTAALEPFGRPNPDPERALRDWPSAGMAWLGVTALLLALVALPIAPSGPPAPAKTAPTDRDGSFHLDGTPPVDLPLLTPDQASYPATQQESTSKSAATPGQAEPEQTEPAQEAEHPSEAEAGTRATAHGRFPTEAGAQGREPGPTPTGLVEAPLDVPRESRPESSASAVEIAPQAPSDGCVPGTGTPYVFRHPAVPSPVELERCVLEQGVPRLLDAPPLSNRLVELVQRYLNDLGFEAGRADGLVGPRTRGAILRFQQSVGMTPTGAISFDLLDQIRAAGDAGNPPNPGTAPVPTARRSETP